MRSNEHNLKPREESALQRDTLRAEDQTFHHHTVVAAPGTLSDDSGSYATSEATERPPAIDEGWTPIEHDPAEHREPLADLNGDPSAPETNLDGSTAGHYAHADVFEETCMTDSMVAEHGSSEGTISTESSGILVPLPIANEFGNMTEWAEDQTMSWASLPDILDDLYEGEGAQGLDGRLEQSCPF